MTGAMIEVDVSGRAGHELRKIADRAGDLADAQREFGEYLLGAHERRFEAEVDPDGQPWAPLAPSTLEQKAGDGILRDSGRLASSLHYQMEGDTLLFGTNVEYAEYQQLGTDPYDIRPKSAKALAWPGAAHPVAVVHHPGLPARPFIGLADADLDYLGRIVADYLMGR